MLGLEGSRNYAFKPRELFVVTQILGHVCFGFCSKIVPGNRIRKKYFCFEEQNKRTRLVNGKKSCSWNRKEQKHVW